MNKSAGPLLVIGLIAMAAQAEQRTSSSSPLPAKGNKAVAQCLADNDAGTGARTPAARPAVAPDLGCGLAADAVATMLKDPATTFIDVRPAVEYNAYHVDGALNISASTLHTKNYLKNRPVILAGSGKGDRDLYTACAELKAAGFKQTHVLRGGMLSWSRNAYPVVGTLAAPFHLASLTPAELFREANFEGNAVIVAGPSKPLASRFPKAIVIADPAPEEVKAAVERWRRNAKGKKLGSVVLVAERNFQGTQWTSAQDTLEGMPLLTYTGTPQAYEQVLSSQQTMWAAQARGPRRSGCPK